MFLTCVIQWCFTELAVRYVSYWKDWIQFVVSESVSIIHKTTSWGKESTLNESTVISAHTHCQTQHSQLQTIWTSNTTHYWYHSVKTRNSRHFLKNKIQMNKTKQVVTAGDMYMFNHPHRRCTYTPRALSLYTIALYDVSELKILKSLPGICLLSTIIK